MGSSSSDLRSIGKVSKETLGHFLFQVRPPSILYHKDSLQLIKCFQPELILEAEFLLTSSERFTSTEKPKDISTSVLPTTRDLLIALLYIFTTPVIFFWGHMVSPYSRIGLMNVLKTRSAPAGPMILPFSPASASIAVTAMAFPPSLPK